MENGNNREQAEKLIKAVVDKPNDSACYIELANYYLQENEYDLALNVYESLLSFEPANIIALTNLGSIYFYKYDFHSWNLFIRN